MQFQHYHLIKIFEIRIKWDDWMISWCSKCFKRHVIIILLFVILFLYSTEVQLFCHRRGYMWSLKNCHQEVLSPRHSGFVENNHLKDGAFYLPCSKCTLQYMEYKWNQHEQRQGRCNKGRFHKEHIDSYQLVIIFWCRLYFKSLHIGMSILIL